MKLKHLLLALTACVVALAVSVGLLRLVPSQQVNVEADSQIDGSVDILGGLSIQGTATTSGLANFMSTTTLFNTLNIDGLNYAVASSTFANATTTLCAVRNPFNATSTLELARIDITTAATSTLEWFVATGTADGAGTSIWSERTPGRLSVIYGARTASNTLAYITNVN